ncbi:MAG: type III-B CRISPR module RAMP protein Cmr1 [Thermodesulfobacteriota bacterium]
MKRLPPPSIDPKDILSSLPQTTESWIGYHCELVTPLYGGGVVAGEVDKAMPIRATAIRGHLRFWWRLLNRNRFSSSSELFKAERAIWGGLGKEQELEASKVKVRIQGIANVSPNPCANYPPGKNYPNWQPWAHPYALFPAQGRVRSGQVLEHPKKLAIKGLSFDLLISISQRLDSSDRKSVLDAVRWWGTFGGVGARTRRGLGAVWVKSVSGMPSFQPVSETEAQKQGMRLVLSGKTATDSIVAWKYGIDKLKDFRQGVGIGRNPGSHPGRPGRSRWPEPGAIRRITGKFRVKGDGTSFQPSQDQPILFPRAAFGLPIIFHFQNERGDRQRDPEDVTLMAMEYQDQEPIFWERMASPIILRPYPVDSGQWRSAALVLPVRPIKDLYLEWRASGRRIVAPDWLPKKSSQTGAHPPVPPMAGYSDPIEAFLNFFRN